MAFIWQSIYYNLPAFLQHNLMPKQSINCNFALTTSYCIQSIKLSISQKND